MTKNIILGVEPILPATFFKTSLEFFRSLKLEHNKKLPILKEIKNANTVPIIIFGRAFKFKLESSK